MSLLLVYGVINLYYLNIQLKENKLIVTVLIDGLVMDVMNLRKTLILHQEKKLKIRPIIAMPDKSSDFQNILDGKDGSQYPKRFNANQLVGELTIWDGIQFEIVFSLEQ